MKKRIYQLLRQSGIIQTKKEAQALVKEGHVIVDKGPVKSIHFFVNPEKKKILVNGRPLQQLPLKWYILLNKPSGYMATREHSFGRPNVFDIIKEDKIITSQVKNTLFAIGRLDVDSTGLLLITNDGSLAHKILRPEHKIKKVYEVKVEGAVTPQEISKLEQGVHIKLEENGAVTSYKTQPCKAHIKSCGKTNSIVEITIEEGKKRQIRRMFGTLKKKVLELKRIKIGELELGSLKAGHYRFITREEIYGKLL